MAAVEEMEDLWLQDVCQLLLLTILVAALEYLPLSTELLDSNLPKAESQIEILLTLESTTSHRIQVTLKQEQGHWLTQLKTVWSFSRFSVCRTPS